MGLRAIDAVQRHSQYRHDKAENFTPYRIMCAIAWYAGDDGVAGVAGDKDKCPKIDTIAERANVHRNTVINWIPLLREAGELATEKHGAGRGTHVVYTILLPVDPELPIIGTFDYANGTTLQSDDVPIPSHSEQGLAEIKELLVQQNALLVHLAELMVQRNGTNGTTLQSDDVHDPYDPFDPEGETRARAERQEDDYWALPAELADSPEFAQKWRDWLVYTQQARITFTPRQAVVNLQRFREWGVDKAILALETALLKGWKNIHEPDPGASPSANGHDPDADWSLVLSWIQGRAEFQDLPPPVQVGIKQAGITSKLKTGYETDMAQKRFAKVMHNASKNAH